MNIAKQVAATVLGLTILLSITGAGLAENATPTATPESADEATPVSTPVVANYADVGSEYDAAEARLIELGHEAIDLLQSGDAEGLYGLLSPAVRQVVEEAGFEGNIDDLETDRVHFEMPAFGIIFDGHFDGDTIEGIFYQGVTLGFDLERVIESDSGDLDGEWTGSIEGDGVSVGIEVRFEGANDELSGRISIPEQGLNGFELEQVGFTAVAQMGAMTYEAGLPMRPDEGFYVAEYSWGDASISMGFGFDSADSITLVQVVPVWPLPPDPVAEYSSDQDFQLPFDGVWWVFWGGDTELQNYHVAAPMQRHAYDIVIWKNGGTFSGDGIDNADYWCWGQPIHAPSAGEVVAVVDGIADNVPGEMNPAEPAGNHVVVQTGENEFLFLAHFMEGTIDVAVGDQLQPGDFVGLTGNSGNSSEPHLHIHLQDKLELFAAGAQGLPLEFSNYLADGEPVETGAPVQGQFIEREP